MQPYSSARSHSAGQRAEVAVHAEHAVGDQQLARRCRQVADDVARGVHVAMGKDLDRRAAEPRAVDDARVVQLVGDDEVVFGEDGGDGAGVGGEAALKDDGGFGFLELREPPLELHVNRHGAGDRAHRAGADAELLERGERFLLEPRMRRQPEVVVRREVDDLAAVDASCARPARRRARAGAGRVPAT